MPSIFYREKGRGFPIILIHGFCETHEIWNGFLQKLAGTYRVIAIDLPGFGQSPLPPSPFSITGIAERVIDLLKDLKIDQCTVIGHSLGGYVTLALAQARPQLLKAFGLFHSTAYSDTEEKRINRNRIIEFVKKQGVPTYIESFIPSLFANAQDPSIAWVVNMASKTPQETLIAYTEAMRDRPDCSEVIRNFHGPILFMAGEKDGGIPVEAVKKQAKLARHASLYIFKDLGHMGMLENESETLEKVEDFIQNAV